MNGEQTRASLYKNGCDQSNLIDEWEQPEVNIWIALRNTEDHGQEIRGWCKGKQVGNQCLGNVIMGDNQSFDVGPLPLREQNETMGGNHGR